MRILSLVPSITETLFDFGLEDNQIVGRTKFCIHPKEKAGKVPIIGGTKNLHIDKIKALKPDLIIANKEENVKEQVELLMDFSEVWVTDIYDLDSNYSFLLELGERLRRKATAQTFVERIKRIIEPCPTHHLSCAYLIWNQPLMSVGGDTFIHSVLEHFGFHSIFKNSNRYPIISEQELSLADCIFLSSEPYPFKERHRIDFQEKFPKKKVILVDGEAFSWYGTHLAHCEGYFEKLHFD
ncbi:Vitamin B12-binding protein precursor [Bergeyella porcorum]|uniref:Vitamin B12-binding protein n=1 Tax=Bergeyella porcorum TaxID=1735111 RepID=A0AAU0EY10_9FLAO